MLNLTRLPLPSLSPTRARDIGRGHLTLAEQYRLAGLDDAAAHYERQAALWLAYARTLASIEEVPVAGS